MAKNDLVPPFHLSDAQREYLVETWYFRRGQERQQKRMMHIDDEWIIACDLIGVSRKLAKAVKEEMMK